MQQCFCNIQGHNQASAFARTSFEETGSSPVAVICQAAPMNSDTPWSRVAFPLSPHWKNT